MTTKYISVARRLSLPTVLSALLVACASTGTPPPSAAAPKAGPAKAAPALSGAATTVGVSNWSEQFSAADAAAFFSPAYASLPGDASKPLYVIAAGNPTIGNGALTLANGRFTIGALGATGTGPSATPGGIFAINNKSCVLTVNVKSASGSGNFLIYVDNNTTSQDSSPHGKASRAIMVGATSLAVGVNTFKLSPSTSGFSGGSFLQFRADSASSVVIDAASLSCN